MRRALRLSIVLSFLPSVLLPSELAQWGGELRFCLHSEPRSLHPAKVDDDASETIRYLTGGVLVRVNRLTQAAEPSLAVSWKILDGGRTIRFQLREGVRFSDGTPFTADDVVFTMQTLLDPATHSPDAEQFRAANLDFSSIFRRLSPTSTWWPVSLETWGAEDYSGLREQWRTPQNAALNADEEVFAVRRGRHETHAGRWCSARRDM